MRYRLRTLLIASFFVASLDAHRSSADDRENSKRINFYALPEDNQICSWLRTVSPSFNDTYASVLRFPDTERIAFRSVDKRENEFGELGVFFGNGVCEIRVSNRLQGAERVRTLAFEVANASLQEEHRQIDKAAAQGFFAAREYAIAHEIYEYEAWRLYRGCLLDVERQLGEGNLPDELFFGIPTKKVAQYQLPPLAVHLKHMETSGHMQHYLSWYEKYYSKRVGTPR